MYNVVFVFNMLSLGYILISDIDLVVANLFMHSIPAMILFYLAIPYVVPGCMVLPEITIHKTRGD